MFIEHVPDEIDLLGFFETEPLLFELDNIRYIYKVKDSRGIELEFAFSIIEGWVSYIVRLNGNEFFHDQIHALISIRIQKDILGEYLDIEMDIKGHTAKIELRVKPVITIRKFLLST